MVHVKKFTFNPFQENSYIIYNDTKECIIVDPGCFNHSEEQELESFISNKKLIPKHLINTHAHIDHVLGNDFVSKKYSLGLSIYKSEYPMLEMAIRSAEMYGIPYNHSPEPSYFLNEGDIIKFGSTSFSILFVPGHSPDHIVLLNKDEKILIGGDVLFNGSIGRTDLPGGNHDELLKNIRTKLFSLDEKIIVYSGHGDETTIGKEKNSNPFFN